MSSRTEKEKQKLLQEKCQTALNIMLRDDDNKYCVDCDAKGPRWASWNIGVFLCIRCAGIHRNLGVHISKVKSVNLDSWTPEQVVSMQQMGNSRARAVYEANLPDAFRRPQNDSALEQFIRAKYEHKKYIAREYVPTPLPKVNWEAEIEAEIRRKKEKKRGDSTPPPVRVELPPVKVPLPERVPTPPSKQKTKPAAATHNGIGSSVDLLGLGNSLISLQLFGFGDFLSKSLSFLFNEITGSDIGTPASASVTSQKAASLEDDIFGGFVDAGTTDNSIKSSSDLKTQEENFFNQPLISEKKVLDKDSILALYGQGTQLNTGFGQSMPSGAAQDLDSDSGGRAFSKAPSPHSLPKKVLDTALGIVCQFLPPPSHHLSLRANSVLI
nr:EOG090X06Q2 [Artemia franciscana]